MRALLDVNLLIALIDRRHAAYEFAHRWLAANRSDGWSTCPMVENGCLRILTNPKYSNPSTPEEVLRWLDEAKADGHYQFWPDDLTVTGPNFHRSALAGHQQVTDIYLLALAVQRRGRLVTFDTGISLETVTGASSENLVVLPTRQSNRVCEGSQALALQGKTPRLQFRAFCYFTLISDNSPEYS